MSFASNRDSGDFSGQYKKTGFFQAEYNEIFLDSIIQCIQENLSHHLANSAHKPLQILDLGAGAGNSTASLQKKLKRANIHAEITATDVSASQIQAAKRFENSNLIFKVEAAESLNNQNRFHVVICLFAFHWFQDKAEVAKKIKAALLTDGLLFALIPLEKPQLFHLRQHNLTLWKSYFENMPANPLVSDPTIYQNAFADQFKYVLHEHKRNLHQFSPNKFAEFLSSWTPESRYQLTKTRSNKFIDALPPINKKRLFQDLLANIPEFKDTDDVGYETKNDNSEIINFNENILVFACSNQKFNFTLKAPDVDAKDEISRSIKSFK